MEQKFCDFSLFCCVIYVYRIISLQCIVCLLLGYDTSLNRLLPQGLSCPFGVLDSGIHGPLSNWVFEFFALSVPCLFAIEFGVLEFWLCRSDLKHSINKGNQSQGLPIDISVQLQACFCSYSGHTLVEFVIVV